MKNYMINFCFFGPEGPKAYSANKIGIKTMTSILFFVKNVYNTMLYIIFQYSS